MTVGLIAGIILGVSVLQMFGNEAEGFAVFKGDCRVASHRAEFALRCNRVAPERCTARWGIKRMFDRCTLRSALPPEYDMRLRLTAAIAAGFLFGPLAVAAQATAASPAPAWTIDMGHSAVTFRVRHLGLSWVRGEFMEWSGELRFDPDRPTAGSTAITIKAASVDTRNTRRDGDVRANYFVVDSFPEMRFTSTRVDAGATGMLRVSGELTMKGITRPVVLDVEIGGVLVTPREQRVAFSASTSIKRQEFGITRNAFVEGAQVVGDVIEIQIDLEAVRPPN